jgi:drug/metabolite transporter (DMT)-like permease
MAMDVRSHRTWPGVPLALLSAVLFGVSTPASKALLGTIAPGLLAGLLYMGSGLGLAGFGAIRAATGMRAEAPLRVQDFGWLALIVLSGGLVGPLLLMVGLAATPASTVSLLLNLEGVFTLGIAWIVFHENVDARVGTGAAAILLAAVLLTWGGAPGGLGWHAIAIVGACLAWSLDNNLTRKLSIADPVQLAMIKGLAAGGVNTTIGLVTGTQFPALGPLLGALVTGFLGYGVSLLCFILALRHLGTARTGAYFSFAPFVGASIGIVVLGDPVRPLFAVSAGLMALGLYLHLSERHEHQHEHVPLAHEHRHVHDAHHQHQHSPGDPIGEPHSHWHQHEQLIHSHPHYPDAHHRHRH